MTNTSSAAIFQGPNRYSCKSWHNEWSCGLVKQRDTGQCINTVAARRLGSGSVLHSRPPPMLPTLKSALLPLITAAPLCRARPIDGRDAALRLQMRAAERPLPSRELEGRAEAAIAIRSAAAMRT